MLQLLGTIVLGVMVGWLLRSKRLHFVGRVTSTLVLLLLFFLGVEVGSSKEVMSTLPTLGGKAVTIGASAMLGSVLLAWVLHRWSQHKR